MNLNRTYLVVAKAEDLFTRYDVDGNGLIDLHEFVHGLMPGDHDEEELMIDWAYESERKAKEAREGENTWRGRASVFPSLSI